MKDFQCLTHIVYGKHGTCMATGSDQFEQVEQTALGVGGRYASDTLYHVEDLPDSFYAAYDICNLERRAMIRQFEECFSNLLEVSSISELDGAVVAVDAEWALEKVLQTPPSKEPLLPALGGLPFTMKVTIQNDLRRWKDAGITPFFVFSGMDVGKKDRPFQVSEESARINEEAWELYNRSQADQAVATFGSSGSVRAEDLFRFLQTILREEKVGFQVAPYSAWAQLSYLARDPRGYVDAIAGSSELLLFNVDKVITKWDFANGEFTWIRRQACMKDLGDLPPEMFVDACMLSGSALLPTLPQLEVGSPRKVPGIRRAVEMMMQMGRSGYSVCLQYQDDPQLRSLDYLDRYRRSRLAVKHHIVLTADGKVEPLDLKHAPGDIHEFIGQRLPDEIYYYLSKGVLGPRILNWRTSGEIIELHPLDNGESEEYHTLVRDQLTELRTSALSLLSQSLHRFYQHKDVTLRCFFDQDNTKVISMRDLADPKPMIASWNVRSDVFRERANKLKECGPLGFVVRSLEDTSFASRTVTKKDLSKPLVTGVEILYNSLWRLLQIRGYVDSKHNLTKWGAVLQATVAALNGRPELEEAAFIAVELARLNLLNARFMFPLYTGAPFRGSDTDRKHTLLVSRVACLGKLRHESIGFTGPLSRHLLGFHSMISAVRSGLRDLAEASLTTLLLNGDAERDRNDFTDLGLDLPFLLDNDCGLGIAVKSYLDELVGAPNNTSPETKKAIRAKGPKEWFPHSENFSDDLDTAFALWDAVYAGVKSSGNLVKDRALWDDVNTWLAPLR